MLWNGENTDQVGKLSVVLDFVCVFFDLACHMQLLVRQALMFGFHDLPSAQDTVAIVCLDFILEQPCAVDDVICRQTLYLFVHFIIHAHFLQRRHLVLINAAWLQGNVDFGRRRAIPKFRLHPMALLSTLPDTDPPVLIGQSFFSAFCPSTMRVVSTNNIKVYTVAGQGVRALPEWLIRQKKRSLRDDPGEVTHDERADPRLSIENRTYTGL